MSTTMEWNGAGYTLCDPGQTSISPLLCVVTGRVCRGSCLLLYQFLYLLPEQKCLLLLFHHQAVHLLGHAFLPATARIWVLKEWSNSLERHAYFSVT